MDLHIIYCNLKIACDTFSPKSRCVQISPREDLVGDSLPYVTTNSSHFWCSLTEHLTEDS